MTVTFGTMPTGGFAATNLSIGAYDNIMVEIIVIVFMIIAGVNFGLHYLFLRKREFRQLFGNPEFKLYVGLLVGTSILVAINLINVLGMSVGSAFRQSSFQAVSIMTTTGFTTANFNTWPSFAKGVLLVLMLIGASAGSTGGALKVSRVLVLLKYTYRRIVKTFNPQIVTPIKVGNRVLSEQVISGVIGMTILYFTTMIVAFIIMSSLGLNHTTALSSVIATLGNVGPGLGMVGPVLDYSFIPAAGKVTLIICMLAGRLELLTVFAILAPSFWKWR
jgi:trk system potassium uptake protein TrkH